MRIAASEIQMTSSLSVLLLYTPVMALSCCIAENDDIGYEHPSTIQICSQQMEWFLNRWRRFYSVAQLTLST